MTVDALIKKGRKITEPNEEYFEWLYAIREKTNKEQDIKAINDALFFGSNMTMYKTNKPIFMGMLNFLKSEGVE